MWIQDDSKDLSAHTEHRDHHGRHENHSHWNPLENAFWECTAFLLLLWPIPQGNQVCSLRELGTKVALAEPCRKPSTTYPYQKRGSLDMQWLRFRWARAFFLFSTNSCNFIFTSVLATAPGIKKKTKNNTLERLSNQLTHLKEILNF